MIKRSRIYKFRVLKKYLNLYLHNWWCNPGQTVRYTILDDFSNWGRVKLLNRYIDKYIKEPDVIQTCGRLCKI